VLEYIHGAKKRDEALITDTTWSIEAIYLRILVHMVIYDYEWVSEHLLLSRHPSFSPSLALSLSQKIWLGHQVVSERVLEYIHGAKKRNEALATYLATSLASFLPNYLPTYLPTSLACYLFTYLPTHPPTYLPTYLPIHLPAFLLPIYLPIYLPHIRWCRSGCWSTSTAPTSATKLSLPT